MIFGFAFVCGNHSSFGADAGFDGVNLRRAVPRQQSRTIRLAPFIEGEIANQAIFDDLGIASAPFPHGQAIEHGWVN